MKRRKHLLLTTMIITVIAIIAAIVPKATANGQYAFTYNYNVNGIPPFTASVNGVDTTIFCRQAGGSLLTAFGNVSFNNVGGGNLTPGLAYALNSTNNKYIQQNMIWLSDLANNTGKIHFKGGAAEEEEARKLMAEASRFDSYYSKLQTKGKDIKFQNTEPELVSSDNEKYKIGPFKLNFYKSEYSGIKDLYLVGENGKRIEIQEIDFGNFVGNKDHIEDGERFYAVFNSKDAKDINKVKLKAEYEYKEASGNYVFYEADPPYLMGSTVQRLLSFGASGGNQNEDDSSTDVLLTIDLKGTVFYDSPTDKKGNADGIFERDYVCTECGQKLGETKPSKCTKCKASGDKIVQIDPRMKDIKVIVYAIPENLVGKPLTENQLPEPYRTATTGDDGAYSFEKLPAGNHYIIRFIYNGQIYEPTTYQALEKIIDNTGKKGKTSLKERSYATDGKANRNAFNNKFNPVTENSNFPSIDDVNNAVFSISAYTGPYGLEDKIKYYSGDTSKEERENINFGLIKRPDFSLNLRKDLIKVDLDINDKHDTREYNRVNKELVLDIRGTDIAPYERAIRTSDLAYKNEANQNNELKVTITYKLQITNTTLGDTAKINAYITKLNEFYDSDYEFVKSYDDSNREIRWQQEGTNGAYKKMHTTDLANEAILTRKNVYLEFQVSKDAITKLLDLKSDVKENYAEIAGYSNKYAETYMDPNQSNVVRHEAGQVAGLIDRYSTPGNFNPNDQKVRNFVDYSYTDEYQKKSGEEKTRLSKEIFEYDADTSPGLKLVVSDDARKIQGNVWEDKATAESLRENLRVGNGIKDNAEKDLNVANAVVELYETKDPNTVVKTATTDANGNYVLEGYIPGDYKVRFRYGINKEADKAPKYNGQDYKSTIYQEENYTDTLWYAKENDAKSDAKDDWNRRQAVNEYSKTLDNYKANVLNNQVNADEFIEKTNMFAETAQMNIEIEYLKDYQKKYDIKNVDFGIIERPRSELTLHKEVEHIKVQASDGTTVFDNSQKAKNLAWTNKQILATVDDNLLHGATIEITYKMWVENTGEKDYTDQTFYYTGKVQNANAIVKTKAVNVVDYIANNVVYDKKKNAQWELVTAADLQNANPQQSQVQNDINLSTKNSIIKAKADNPLLQKDLTPTETTEQSKVFVSKVMTNDTNSSDTLKYDNIAEITTSHNDSGRRSYSGEEGARITSIPGNLDPTKTPLVATEPDTGLAQETIVLPPFGQQNILWYILGAIGLAGVLAGGIIIIKKKVLKK